VSSGHPSDADRERGAAPVVDRVQSAIEAGDVSALAAAFADHGVCLAGDERIEDRAEIKRRLANALSGPSRLVRRQQQGAHAVVGWEGGTLVLEIRRGEVVFAVVV
jgi:hypothetical protein